MSIYLNRDELALIIQKTPQHLSTNRFLHYEKCNYCRHLHHQQLTVHKVLVNIKPLQAPASVLNNVIRTVGAFSSKTSKSKTDWVFLLAITTLFALGAWFIFSGGVGTEISQYLSKIIPDIESANKAPAIINFFKEGLKGLHITFNLFKTNGYSLYLLFGFLSVLFYMFLDKKFGYSYRIK